MAEHTPAPWHYGDHDDGCFRIYGPQGNRDTCGPVAEAMHRHTDGTRQANARLIAAAPELLKVLTGLQKNFGEYWPQDYQDLVAAVIAKATGEKGQ